MEQVDEAVILNGGRSGRIGGRMKHVGLPVVLATLITLTTLGCSSAGTGSGNAAQGSTPASVQSSGSTQDPNHQKFTEVGPALPATINESALLDDASVASAATGFHAVGQRGAAELPAPPVFTAIDQSCTVTTQPPPEPTATYKAYFQGPTEADSILEIIYVFGSPSEAQDVVQSFTSALNAANSAGCGGRVPDATSSRLTLVKVGQCTAGDECHQATMVGATCKQGDTSKCTTVSKTEVVSGSAVAFLTTESWDPAAVNVTRLVSSINSDLTSS